MKLNSQPIEKRVDNSATGLLDVHSIFQTIQGEGPFCGTPCIFIRLAGCNLQCPWCDTEYTKGRHWMTPLEILEEIANYVPSGRVGVPKLVVITGGEPFRQNLSLLFKSLVNTGHFVQVESNGTLPPSAYQPGYSLDTSKRQGVYIVCSPKAGRVNPALAEAACCFKYVVAHNSVREEDGLPLQALGHTANPYVARPPEDFQLDRPIYIQPMDAQEELENALNVYTAKMSALKHGYILQLQIHKLIGVE